MGLSTGLFAGLPDPGRASTLDELSACLRALKVWAGNRSYEAITARVNAGRLEAEVVGKTTVVDCFRPGRRRIDADLVVAVVDVLHPDPGYVHQWRQALRVVAGQAKAATQVRVQDILPQDLPEFAGRRPDIDAVRQIVQDRARESSTVVISAFEGMAGVGKTKLAIHLGHVLAGERGFDRVMFVNLRGFHHDPAQPPADPAAVLDGFLRLLGVPGQQIPHRLHDRVSLYRRRLAGIRCLIVLDNAANEEQVRPLLPVTAGCVTLVTSRRSLSELDAVSRYPVDVFTEAEAVQYLATAAPDILAGDDPGAAVRIAHRCGYLPLALALVAGQLHAKPGWTLTDHADRLDERHQGRRLDSAVELAFDVSYRGLPAGERRLLRLLAQHPGQDFDAYAAAAATDTDVATAQSRLHRLCTEHLLQSTGPGRYTLHDLLRAFAATRAADEDRLTDRNAALTRLLDHYRATATAAANHLEPAAAPLPPQGPTLVDLLELSDALRWLDAERANLLAVSRFAADQDWPAHAIDLSTILRRYLVGFGTHSETLSVHLQAAEAAERIGDDSGQAKATLNAAGVYLHQGRQAEALETSEQALQLFRKIDDQFMQAAALNSLGIAERHGGQYQDAISHFQESVDLQRRLGISTWQGTPLTNLGVVEYRMGRYHDALQHYREALCLVREQGDRLTELNLLALIGEVELALGRCDEADQRLARVLDTARELQYEYIEGSVLITVGCLHVARGDLRQADTAFRDALSICRNTGDRHNEAGAHNGLGELAQARGRFDEAVTEHTRALTVAVEVDQQALAHAGLGRARQALGDHDEARRRYRKAQEIWARLNPAKADQVAALLAAL
ncbi:tetratricopeptide repeat protein [Krasilnikovia sp. MM14-A1259]